MVNDVDAARRGAARFYWGWLMVASGVSIAANVGHALLILGHRQVVLTAAAAVLAVVPPLVQIAATHSISWLVRTRASGRTYRSALAMTVVVGGFAFVLSFVAIRSLAAFLGFTEQVLGIPVAAIFPLVIDVSIAQATMSLLALPAPAAAGWSASSVAAEPAGGDRRPATAEDADPVRVGEVGGHRPALSSTADAGATQVQGPVLTAVTTPHGAVVPGAGSAGDADLWVIATRIVEAKITTKSPALVADLLADHVAGLGPTAIARKNDVHHSVVRKVLRSAGDQLRAS